MNGEKMPAISVIMGVYNQFNKQQLLDSINSILNQTFSDFEFIIYNDGSDEVVAGYLEEISKTDTRIVFFGKAENHGLAYSLNSCIEKAKGKYIARMDADDISLPNRLEIQKDFLDKNTEYAWCGCNTDLFDENGVWGQRFMPKEPSKEDYLKYSPYVHPTVMYRSEIFDEHLGYLESKDVLRCEDYEIFMRFRYKGLRGANIQEILFQYREDRESYKKRTWKHRINEAKCRYRNYKKLGILFPVGIFCVIRPIVGGLIPRELIRFLKREESRFAQKQDRKRKEIIQ